MRSLLTTTDHDGEASQKSSFRPGPQCTATVPQVPSLTYAAKCPVAEQARNAGTICLPGLATLEHALVYGNIRPGSTLVFSPRDHGAEAGHDRRDARGAGIDLRVGL